jgi:hypothetical protein
MQALVERHVQVQHKLLVGQSPPGTTQAAVEQTHSGSRVSRDCCKTDKYRAAEASAKQILPGTL